MIEQAREIEFTQLIRGARAHALSLSNTLTTHFCAVLRHRFLPRTPSLPSPPLLPLVLVPVGEIGTTERGNGFLRPHKIRKFIVTVPANLFPLTTIPPPPLSTFPPCQRVQHSVRFEATTRFLPPRRSCRSCIHPPARRICPNC